MSTAQISPPKGEKAPCYWWGKKKERLCFPRVAFLYKLRRENRAFLLLLFGKIFKLMKRRTPNKCAGAMESIVSCPELMPFLVLK